MEINSIYRYVVATKTASDDHLYIRPFKAYKNLSRLRFCNVDLLSHLSFSSFFIKDFVNFLIKSFQTLQHDLPMLFRKHSLFFCKSPNLFQWTGTDFFFLKSPSVTTHFFLYSEIKSSVFRKHSKLTNSSKALWITCHRRHESFHAYSGIARSIHKITQDTNRRKERVKERPGLTRAPQTNSSWPYPLPQTACPPYRMFAIFKRWRDWFGPARPKVTDLDPAPTVCLWPACWLAYFVRSAKLLCDVVVRMGFYNPPILIV